jgi:hypothetical protein
VDELDSIIERLYEDHVAGVLSVERFAKMSAKYEREQKDAQSEIPMLEAAVAGQETQLGDVGKFLSSVRKYTEIQELTPAVANELIDRIVVHEPEQARGNRIQEVEIIYVGIGAVDLSLLTIYQAEAV